MALNALVPWSLQQAIERGMEFYPIQVTNWGDAGATNPDVETGVDPLLISGFSLAGVAIAPNSMVAQCGVIYNPSMDILPVSPTRSLPAQSIVVTKDAPYFGSLPGPLSIQAVLDNMYYDTFTQENGTPGAFGFAANAYFRAPELNLNLLLRGSGIQAPVGRQPDEEIDIQSALTGAATVDALRIVSVDGRKRVRISVRNPGAGPITFTVTGVQCRSTSTPLYVQRSVEISLVGSTAVAAGVTVTVTLETPNITYIVLRAAAAGAAQNVNWTTRLED